MHWNRASSLGEIWKGWSPGLSCQKSTALRLPCWRGHIKVIWSTVFLQASLSKHRYGCLLRDSCNPHSPTHELPWVTWSIQRREITTIEQQPGEEKNEKKNPIPISYSIIRTRIRRWKHLRQRIEGKEGCMKNRAESKASISLLLQINPGLCRPPTFPCKVHSFCMLHTGDLSAIDSQHHISNLEPSFLSSTVF
ncbi:macrophage immunometabolism regulator isoform X2 [Lagenorhynchus albirostris]|uniref:macrophage immunometabolism regulator isoform X2 n=1 Tax=Lagenorhynchus albirostris TaxID=27610 RepID=UPI0028F0BA36|nr:macrophage immunometabolism regulator isoform X2 [Lagenorhynchus albirostris]